jgi:hypothetical protein
MDKQLRKIEHMSEKELKELKRLEAMDKTRDKKYAYDKKKKNK